MSVVELVLAIFITIMLLLPFLGLTVWASLASVDVVRRLCRSPAAEQLSGAADHHELALEEEVETLRTEVRRLEEADAFHRALFETYPESEGRAGSYV
jgi:hypothetical protein